MLTTSTSMLASKGTSSAPASFNAAIAIANVSLACRTTHSSSQHFWVLASCCASLGGDAPTHKMQQETALGMNQLCHGIN